MTEQGFIDDIIARPESDQPRLIYADWLEEHGQAERGEFIRVQCAITDLNLELRSDVDCGRGESICPGCSERRALQSRAKELLDDHYQRWFVMLNRVPGFGETLPLCWWLNSQHDVGRRFSSKRLPSSRIEGRPTRGFISEILCGMYDWLAHGREIVRCQPMEKVVISDRTAYPPERHDRVAWFHPDVPSSSPTGSLAIPEEVFTLIEGFDSNGVHPARARWFARRDLANRALGLACLKWSKT